MILRYNTHNVNLIKSILVFLARNSVKEHGYTLYIKCNKMYVQRDKGSSFLTVSDFTKITKDEIEYVLYPDKVILMHTHPFQLIATPSLYDIKTLKTFKEYYTNAEVDAYVIGRMSITKY